MSDIESNDNLIHFFLLIISDMLSLHFNLNFLFKMQMAQSWMNPENMMKLYRVLYQILTGSVPDFNRVGIEQRTRYMTLQYYSIFEVKILKKNL